MKFSTPCLVAAVLLQQLVTSVAFAPKLPIRSLSMAGSPTTIVSMADDEQMQLVDDTDAVPVEPDSHDELMYALGVNLARQLGDIRPLVENGEELAQVAKGLLDTVVGRLNEGGQTAILLKRGTELNQMIAGRA
jgi:hypothetical protein